MLASEKCILFSPDSNNCEFANCVLPQVVDYLWPDASPLFLATA